MKDKRTVVFSVKVVLPVEDNSSNFEATTRKVFWALHGHFDNYEVLIDDERTSLRNQLLREFVFQRHTASLKDPLLVVHPEELAQMAARLADAVIEVMTNPIQNIVSLRDVTGEALYTRGREPRTPRWQRSSITAGRPRGRVMGTEAGGVRNDRNRAGTDPEATHP